jgi:TetR/AcrR family transcriptional regulator, cholesterol catabolism regulator
VGSVSTEALCTRIFERHRDVVRVRKANLAVANLARIIEATLKLSNKRGFHATSLRDLAAASGLSMGGLYSYFGNKTTLLSMILDTVTAIAVEILSDPPEGVAEDARAHLAWIVDTHVRLSEAMHPWFVFAFMEANAFPPAERQIALDGEAATEGIIAQVLERGVRSGAFAIGEVGLSAALIKPLLQDWYVKRAKYRRRGTSIEAYIEAVTAFIDAAVSAKAHSPVRAAS